MQRRHLLLAILVTCLLAFFHVGVLGEPTDAASVASVYAAVIAVVVLSVPVRRRANYALILPSTLLLYLPLRQLSGYPVPQTPLAYIISELGFIAIAVTLAGLVARDASSSARLQDPDQTRDSATADSIARAALHREIRRARNYERPLSLLALEIDKSSIDRYLQRVLPDSGWEDSKQKLASSIIDTLSVALEDYIVLARDGEHLVIALPEVRNSQLPAVVDKIRRVVATNVGVELKIGSASLHEDGMVLEALLEKAVQDIHRAANRDTGSSETIERLPHIPSFPEQRVPFAAEAPITPGEVFDGFGDHQPS